jgi:CheY-like chemotaxis protein
MQTESDQRDGFSRARVAGGPSADVAGGPTADPTADLPRDGTAHERPAPRAAAPIRVPVVLLVDDDDYVRQAVRSILRRLNVRIVEASTAAGALEQWKSESPVLALVDLGLPDGDGLDLVADLRARGGDRLGIVVVTGQVPDEQVVRAGGADALVLKPFRLSELRDVVQAQVTARSARAAGQEQPPPG